MKNKNYSELIKEISGQTKNQTIEKIKKNIKVLFAIVFLGLIFFSYEFLDKNSEDYINTKVIADKAYKQNAISLKAVKDYAKGTAVFNTYLKDNLLKKKAVKKFKIAQKNQKTFGFNTLKLFSRELCLFLGFFCYALFNLFRSFYFDRKNIGVKIIHGFIISVCMFYFFWIFQQFQDFNKATYILMIVISSSVVVLAVRLITKYQDHRVNRLKKGQFKLANFTFKNTKPEKREEMLDLIKEITINK